VVGAEHGGGVRPIGGGGLRALLQCRRRKKKVGWASGPKGQMDRLATGPIGLEVEGTSFRNKNWIFEYTKALEICRRFRRDFDVGIFPKFF
jgi:hypothetical protein